MGDCIACGSICAFASGAAAVACGVGRRLNPTIRIAIATTAAVVTRMIPSMLGSGLKGAVAFELRNLSPESGRGLIDPLKVRADGMAKMG